MALIVDRIQGLESSAAVKVPVIVAAPSNITLYGEQTIDTIAVTVGKRVLVPNQTDKTLNGIYDVQAQEWTRSLDFDGANDVVDGTAVYVVDGTAPEDGGLYKSHFFRLIADTDEVIFGTTEIEFEKIFFESEVYALAAAASASEAMGYRDDTVAAAAAITFSLHGTSVSSVVIGTGSKSFTTQPNRAFGVGSYVFISSTANPANFMHGQVTSYNTTTGALVVNVSTIGGSGTLASWNIDVSGPKGAQGNAGTGTGDMLKSENLSGLASNATARNNIGLKSAAILDSVDEDNMTSNSDILLPTQQSVKAYVDSVRTELNRRASVVKAASRNANANTTYTFNYTDGAWQPVVVSSNCTFAFNFPANEVCSIILQITNGGAYTITGLTVTGGLSTSGVDHVCIYTDGTTIFTSMIKKGV